MMMLILGLIFIACKGPEGPAGSNGVAACSPCHTNSAKLVEKANQYAQSVHATGLVYEYANRTQCAMCHTHEGFMDFMNSTLDTITAPVAGLPPYGSPSTIQCRTCHMIHTKYDTTDWKFTNITPFKTVFDGKLTTIDIGTGNLCGRCHQSRAITSPTIVETQDSFSITTNRWGPHHGGQSNVLFGNSAFDLGVGGSLDGLSGTSGHAKISNSCARCHMAALPNLELTGIGGHSFGIATTDPTSGVKTTNVMGCSQGSGETCHTSVDSKFNPSSNKTKVTTMTNDILAIRAELKKRGWITLDASWPKSGTIKGDLVNATSKKDSINPGPLMLSKLQAKLLANYFIINQDQSWGVHNPKYVSAIITQMKTVLGLP